jgi:hypothetical protein
VVKALYSPPVAAHRRYDHCAWQTLGQGQFRPLDGSQPYLGQAGQVEQVEVEGGAGGG